MEKSTSNKFFYHFSLNTRAIRVYSYYNCFSRKKKLERCENRKRNRQSWNGRKLRRDQLKRGFDQILVRIPTTGWPWNRSWSVLAESQGKLAIDRRAGFVFTRSAATGTILVFEARRMKARNKLLVLLHPLIFFFYSNEFEAKAGYP